jgi:lipopolysaccharide transport system permease protein
MLPVLLNVTQTFPVLSETVPFVATHWRLVWVLSKRELSDRYSGHIFGFLWVVGHPLVVLGLYVFVFAFVLKLRVRDAVGLPGDYTAYLLSGLIAWTALQDAAGKSCTAITARANLLKQMLFPPEVLPIQSIVISVLTQLVSAGLLTVYLLKAHGRLPWTYGLLPVLLAFQVILMVGVSFALAACAVFFRDLKDVVSVATLVGLYAVPVLYPLDWVPTPFHLVVVLNPFSHMIWCYQDALVYGSLVHSASWVVFPIFSLGVLIGGARLFRRLKPYFAGAL